MNKGNKSKIIAISGEPVSGKGSTVKVLINKLKEQGYLEENIHVRTTGNEFRQYFDRVVSFVRNINDLDTLKTLGKTKEMQDILKNKEYREVLKNTIAQIQKEHINLEQFKISDATTSPEFSGIRKVVDTLIDGNIQQLGIKLTEEAKDDEIWIIDSRLAFHNIPSAFSVRLTTNPNVAAQRLFNDTSRNKSDTYTSLEEAKQEREKRREGEKARYKKRYGVDLEDVDNYDLIIDTSYSSVEDVANTILECQKCQEKGEKFGKMWRSPKTLLPLQEERATLDRQPFSLMDLGELIQEIETNGYIPSEEIETVNVEGINYIIEGHHRNFGSLYAGKTLVPYKTIARDDEKIPGYQCTARQRASSLNRKKLYGHEYLIEDALNRNNSDNIKVKFSYEEIYPGIYEKLQENEGPDR